MKLDKSINSIREHQEKESVTSFLHDEVRDNRVRKTTDTRKPKLTLNHLNRLNALKKARTLEANRKSKQVQRMYSQGDLTTTVTKSTEHAPEGTTTTIDREYEEILERYHLDKLFLFESTSDLKTQYKQGKTLVLTGLMYDNMTDKEEPVFKSDSELSAAVAALQADVKDEIEEYAGTPVYCALDHSMDTPFVDLKNAFGELTNVYSNNSQIYGEIELLPDNDNARQLIDLAESNNNYVSVSITYFEDEGGTVITGCDVVSVPAVPNALMKLEAKDVSQYKYSIDPHATLNRLKDNEVSRKEKTKSALTESEHSELKRITVLGGL